ncbi:hypothetical protein PRIPAC_97976 [Pristionchus pacificus]|uniref:Uncharacterized protein n=1 Tax=Pristionchus pacificus TaxID=54126 RepID=A0A2A6D1S7_PRIPA|nr:hypothetical protein PRIPAC_97976 [Pristionchus pacificus]|eukprot:PDM84328.1 hypothetical protein PRIPAC_33351 [Pristionchus pacificus]
MRLLLGLLSLLATAEALKCHSCLTQCKTTGSGTISAEKCDCVSAPKDMCEGNACFAKIELFTDERTAIMQKGCITDVPGGTPGCQYASNSDTIHCFCQGEKCNNRMALNDFVPARLPSVECCACSEKHGEHCSHDECPRKCTGHYCVVDFDGLEQGCGLGYPRLQSFLRMPKYTEYEATSGTVMNGCTCTNPSGHCNDFNATRQYQIKNVIERKLEEQNYCYSLVHKSMKPFGPEVFKRSGTCEGQYCFISYTTSEIVLESVGILAGCLKVDDDKKITEGCTAEYSTNSTEPLAKHCVCKSHLCNFHHLITETADTRPRSSSPSSSLSSRIQTAPTTKLAASVVPAAAAAAAASASPATDPVAVPAPTLSNRVEDHVASSAISLLSSSLLALVLCLVA